MSNIEPDYLAESDLYALQRAREVESSPQRIERIRRHVSRINELADEFIPKTRKGGFNGAVRSKSHAKR